MIDPTTGEALVADFPIESIRQLKQLLENNVPRYNVEPLLNKIDGGLNAMNEAAARVRQIKNQYDTMTADQQYFIKLYLTWLFIYGMWMRFWKGPGFPWPTEYLNIHNQEARNLRGRCSPRDREEHAFIQQSIRSALMGTYEKDPVLRQWINSLPYIEYNFRDGRPNIGNRNIKQYIDRLMLGDECMGYAGDRITGAAYYLIIQMFGLRQPGAFDQFITEMLPAVLNIESQVVNYELANIIDPNINNEVRRRVRILQERQTELAKPIPKQEPFLPNRMTNNPHTY